MFDFSKQIDAFFNDRVRLSDEFKQKLLDHRQANRDRIISRLPKEIHDIRVSDYSFKPQGSMAMKTIIQTRFPEEEYDIDDGLCLKKEDLKDTYNSDLTVFKVKSIIQEILKDERFTKQPEIHKNCVRVFYANSDEEKHHVDFPIYRIYFNSEQQEIRELASEADWILSNPTQVNSWFETEIKSRNIELDGKGTQLRILIQLLKRFCRSRREWDMPNGMKLTMLVAECQNDCYDRLDDAFRKLLKEIKVRLEKSKNIQNMADPTKPCLTTTNNDLKVCNLLNQLIIALSKMEKLDDNDCKIEDAIGVWDWIFKSDGFFEDISKSRNSSNGKFESINFANNEPNNAVDLNGGGRYG